MNTMCTDTNQSIQTVVRRRCSALTLKKRMLVLCHGRKHRKIKKRITDEYDLIFVDYRKSCNPDIVMDLTGNDLGSLFHHGPFDAVAFIHAPFSVFSHRQIRATVPQLLKQNDGFIINQDEKEGVIDLDEEDSFSNYKFFRLQTWESLFPNIPIKFLNLL
jgi:hypothetical protein